MQEEVKFTLDELRAHCDRSVHHVINELGKLRVGKAMPNMLDSVQVEYYGSKVPISQVANISTPDAKTLMVKPWEKTMLPEIEKAIIYANLGLNPQNDGEQVIINVPPLTEDRRRQIVKHAKTEGENGKIGLRSYRKEALDMIKSLKNDGLSEDLAKDAESDIQDIINNFTKKIDDLVSHKEEEIMKI